MTEQVVRFAKPTRTSFSALSTFEECPKRYEISYLHGVENKVGAAAERGTRLHLACERFLKNEIPIQKLPLDFKRIREELEKYRLVNAKAEEVWLCTHDGTYQEVEDEHTRFKAVVDIHYRFGDKLIIRDLKTGQSYPEHDDQLQAYALLGFSRYPDVKEVIVAPLYLEGLGSEKTYTVDDRPYLLAFWQVRWGNLFAATEYPANPAPKTCRWCSYRASKGGPCDYA